MSNPKDAPSPPAAPSDAPPSGAPPYRPLERFWPYLELPEQPSAEELASLDPDLHDALYGRGDRPFSVTLVFPRFDAPDYARAVELSRGGADYRETGEGDAFRSRARFLPSDAVRLRDVFQIVGRFDETEVLIDDRRIPFARELWLPLFWYLLPR